MEDLSWAYHELENLYDDDVESESSSKNSSGGGGGYRNNEDDSYYDVDGNEEDYYTPSSRTARLCSNDRRITTTTTVVATQKRKKGNGKKTKKTKMKTKHNFIISQNKSEKSSTITRVLKNCHVPNRSSSMQHLMMGIESPSLFSPRCFTMGIGRNSSSLDIVAIDEERTKNTTDDVSVGKRIEVQWDMDDGSKEWYAGTVTSISNDKTEAVLLYDDGECCLMDIVDHTEWRTVTATEPIAAAAATTTPENTCNDTYAIVPKAREGISSLPPCNTIISGTVLPSSPIVKKKKKKTSANTTTKTKNVKDSEIRSSQSQSQSQSQLQLQLLIAEKRKRIDHKSHPARRRPVPLPIK